MVLAIIVLLIGLAIAVIAAILLALGTGLSLLFAVSVWEATVVVMVVTAGALWFLSGFVFRPYPADLEPLEDPDEEVPTIFLTDIPLPSRQRRRKRKR